MRICDLIKDKSPFLSLEFFPPKEKEAWPRFFEVVDKLKSLGPLFASVTYGAGGSTQDNTLEIVTRMKRDHGIEPVTHLTSVGASAEKLDDFLKSLQEADIENILALRGDPPKGEALSTSTHRSSSTPRMSSSLSANGIPRCAWAARPIPRRIPSRCPFSPT